MRHRKYMALESFTMHQMENDIKRKQRFQIIMSHFINIYSLTPGASVCGDYKQKQV